MKILDTNKAKKIISGLLAVNMAAGLSSCAYVDEILDSWAGSEISSSQTDEKETGSEADSAAEESSSDTDESTDEIIADNSSEDISEGYPDSNSQVQTTAPEITDSEVLSQGDGDSRIDEYNNGTDSALSTDSNTDSQSDSEIVTPALNAIYDKYAEVIYNYSQKCSEDPSYIAEYCGYLILDIDLNGTPELLIQMGTCEADREVIVYTYDGEEAQLTGSFSMWRSTIGFIDDVLYTETSTLGTYTLYTITISEGEVVREKVDIYEESQLTDTLAFYGFDNSAAIDSLEETSII